MREMNVMGNEFVGKKLEDVKKIKGLKYRVRSEDGQAYFGTCDVQLGRYNFFVENGIIVGVKMG